MRHGIRGRKLGRTTNQRKALFGGLAKSLIKHEQITTTLPKAKDLRPIVEKIVTLGKQGGLANHRRALTLLGGDKTLASKIMGPLADRYKERQGGYTRIVKAGNRHGDNAPMAIIEFIDRDPDAKMTDAGPTSEKEVDDEEEVAAEA